MSTNHAGNYPGCANCRVRTTAIMDRLLGALARRMTPDQQAGAREEVEAICEEERVPLDAGFLRPKPSFADSEEEEFGGES